ncbi:MAG: hypothetical protein ACR2PJ_07920, partial [Pseudomonadales bacterium]
FCQRLKCSKNRTALLNFVATHFHQWRQLPALEPSAVQKLIQATDGYRRKDRFLAFNTTCAEILNAQEPGKGEGDKVSNDWRQLLDLTSAVSAADVDASTTSVYVGVAIDAERLKRITEYLQGTS